MTRIVLDDFAGHAFMLDLAEALQRAGNDTTYTYCDTNLSPHAAFDDAEVPVQPISTRRPFEKYSIARRVINELEYGWGSARVLRRRRAEVSILNNLPLLSLAAPLLVGRLIGAHRIVWLQDVQSGLVAGISGNQGTAARTARRVEAFLLRRADTVIAISNELAESARKFGIRPQRLCVIENWAPLDDIDVGERDNVWSRQHGLGERPRFVYSGTLARKHTPEVLVELAAAAPEADVVVVSEGVGADWLSHERDERELTNLRVLPFQPFESLPNVLASADILVALLTQGAAGHSVPSKVLSYLCADRPILASIPADNAAARMVSERAGAGIIVEPGDTDAFVAAAKSLLADPERRRALGAAGRRFAEATFSSDRVAEQIAALTAH